MTQERTETTQNKKWFITGVSSGIGRALAVAALGRGDTVAGTVRRQEDLREFEALAPGRARGFLLDLDRHADIGPVVSKSIESLGGVDIAVNNAGRSIYGAVEETGLDEARGIFNTNLFAPLVVTQAFLPHFRARGAGRFVNISSGCGISAVPGVGIYSASKFALEGLSEAVALEVGGFGISVTIVEPGAVNSNLLSRGTAETERRLPGYAALSGHGKAALNAYYEACASTPETVAAVILDAMDTPEPPLRLLVGDDVRGMARTRLEAWQALVEG